MCKYNADDFIVKNSIYFLETAKAFYLLFLKLSLLSLLLLSLVLTPGDRKSVESGDCG